MRWRDRLRLTLRAMVGGGDYAAYLAHHSEAHPGIPPLSERDYHRAKVDRRYGGISRCC